MAETTVLHNPRCSTSRAALDAAQEANVDVEVLQYLKEPLTREALLELLGKLEDAPTDLVRRDTTFKELGLTDADVAAVTERFVAGAKAMEGDGWWAGPATSNKAIRRSVLREMLAVRWRSLRGRAGSASGGAGSSPVPAE